MIVELAEEGREAFCFRRRGRNLRAGLNDRFWGDLGEVPIEPLGELPMEPLGELPMELLEDGASSSGMLMGGVGASGRVKSGCGWTKAC